MEVKSRRREGKKISQNTMKSSCVLPCQLESQFLMSTPAYPAVQCLHQSSSAFTPCARPPRQPSAPPWGAAGDAEEEVEEEFDELRPLDELTLLGRFVSRGDSPERKKRLLVIMTSLVVIVSIVLLSSASGPSIAFRAFAFCLNATRPHSSQYG